MPLFTPPSAADVGPVFPTPGLPRNARREPSGTPAHLLLSHYAPMSRYLWVLRIGGSYATYDYPTDVQVNAATERYCGPTTVSASVAAALTAAGYGSQLS